jgi:acyl carrier protein
MDPCVRSKRRSCYLNDSVINRIFVLAADVFQVPEAELVPGSSPDTVQTWDSLHHLSFVLSLEQEFAIQILPEEIEQLLSIELTADLIEEKLRARLVQTSSGQSI